MASTRRAATIPGLTVESAITKLLAAPSVTAAIAPGSFVIFRSTSDTHSLEYVSNTFRPCKVVARNPTSGRSNASKVYVVFAGQDDAEAVGFDPSNLIDFDANLEAATMAYQQGTLDVLKAETTPRAKRLALQYWLEGHGAYAMQDARIATSQAVAQRALPF